jgi:hypothetical protein
LYYLVAEAAVEWLIAGGVMGMMVAFKHAQRGTLNGLLVKLDPTQLLLLAAAAGTVVFGVPLWLLWSIMDATQ